MKVFTMKFQTNISLIIATLIANGCSIGPDYQKPRVQVPVSYKEAVNFTGWKVAEPRDHKIGGAWWSIYEDEQLSALIADATKANQNIAEAEAHYRQAEALSRVAQASLFPAITGNASAKRSQTGNANAQSTYAGGISATWEADLWGRIKHDILSNDASLAASAADLNSAILSVQATLAQNYFQLRILDSHKKLLDDTAVAYERSLTLTNNRYKVGLASRTEIAQAEAQLRTTRAQAIDITGQRAQLEHAIAVLTGRTPAEFSLAAVPLENTTQFKIPDTPANVPSELLERRPDIAAAERRVAAANAQVGVTKAAFYPSLNLVGNFGTQSNSISNLLSLPSRVWSLGPLFAVSIFDGGQRKGQTDAAIAIYDATVSTYKQTVLNGFQEVEDNLALLHTLENEAKEQDAAVKYAEESLQQTENRYKAGTVDYLSVVIVQTTALTAESNALSILGRRLNANIALIKALGGKI